MASKIYPTFSKGVHGTSIESPELHATCSFHGRPGMFKGLDASPGLNVDKLFMLLSRLDVKLSIWDRNFQNNNCFHLEISIRIL